jgi:hypothetical protein
MTAEAIHDHASEPPPALYGIAAEFDTSEALLRAARAAHLQGYTRMDAYSPFPIEGMAEVVARHPNPMPRIMFLGGLAGALTGYGLQYYCAVIAYKINVAGRPYHSWPSFIPVTFELTILFSAISGLIGMLAVNGLPKPWHPIFSTPHFERATRDGFFLCIESDDPRFDPHVVRRFLSQQGAKEVHDVED